MRKARWKRWDLVGLTYRVRTTRKFPKYVMVWHRPWQVNDPRGAELGKQDSVKRDLFCVLPASL